LVQHHEVKENGWDLNIGRYLITEAIEGMTVETALNQLAKAQAALQEANDRLSECLRAAGYA
jgi:type I restriction enzyme M protein